MKEAARAFSAILLDVTEYYGNQTSLTVGPHVSCAILHMDIRRPCLRWLENGDKCGASKGPYVMMVGLVNPRGRMFPLRAFHMDVDLVVIYPASNKICNGR